MNNFKLLFYAVIASSILFTLPASAKSKQGKGKRYAQTQMKKKRKRNRKRNLRVPSLWLVLYVTNSRNNETFRSNIDDYTA